MNMDGGGSVTMVKANNFNLPYDLNHSSYIAAYGRERSVGSHFGVSAKPLPGFINDLAVTAQSTNATITWTTISNSTSQVEYGTTTNLGTFTTLDSALVTNHSVTLTGLSPTTDYYYRAISVFGGTSFYATNRFVTSISTVPNLSVMLFEVTNSWKWNTNNLSATNWMARTYVDTNWSSGPGLLYLEDNAAINPKNTPLPPNNGVPINGTIFPFPTYYFRTSFTCSNNPAGATLLFTNRIDDGAVFYLNGVEIQRVRMNAGAVTYATLANLSACNGSGDATCEDVFTISGNLITNLVIGTNILAAEVHQINTTSSDIVFGAALAGNFLVSTTPRPQLDISRTGNITTLSWAGSGFTLQQTPQISLPTNVWTDVPGPIITSPFSVTNPPATKFYRLRN